MTTEVLIPNPHSIFAPSSGQRIAICGASLHATKGLPDTSSYDAVEGTVAHTVHEYCLVNRTPATEFIGRVYRIKEADREYEITVDADMAAHVQESVDWCLELTGEHFVEERVRIDPWTPIPNQSGTCDHGCFTSGDFGERLLVITDLKFGKGVKVFAYRNVQLALYALGFLAAYDWLYAFDRVQIRISQPRLDHRDTWEVSVKELYEFGEWIKERFVIAWAPGAPFKADEHACQFCKLRPRCPAHAEMVHEMMSGLFEDLTIERHNPVPPTVWPEFAPDVNAMTIEQLATVVKVKTMIVGFLEAVEKKVTHVLFSRGEVPDWKLVEGRSRRSWTNEAAARKYLAEHGINRDRFIVTKTVSPAAAEKLLPKPERKGLENFYSKPTGRPTLAPATDKRPALALDANAIFDDMSEPDDDEDF